MPDFIVQWNYRSGIGGPWSRGDRVGLDEAAAAAINVDSPGVLVPVPEQTPDPLTHVAGIDAEIERALNSRGVWTFAQIAAAAPEDLGRLMAEYSQEAGTLGAKTLEQAAEENAATVRMWQESLRALTQASQDRMMRKSKRRDRKGDPGDQGPITKADFKATKGP